MTLKNKILKALGREEVQWYREFGVLAPFCPYCGEPAYDTHRCAFCGRNISGGIRPTHRQSLNTAIIQRLRPAAPSSSSRETDWYIMHRIQATP